VGDGDALALGVAELERDTVVDKVADGVMLGVAVPEKEEDGEEVCVGVTLGVGDSEMVCDGDNEVDTETVGLKVPEALDDEVGVALAPVDPEMLGEELGLAAATSMLPDADAVTLALGVTDVPAGGLALAPRVADGDGRGCEASKNPGAAAVKLTKEVGHSELSSSFVATPSMFVTGSR
jgi:hypothetical protein